MNSKYYLNRLEEYQELMNSGNLRLINALINSSTVYYQLVVSMKYEYLETLHSIGEVMQEKLQDYVYDILD